MTESTRGCLFIYDQTILKCRQQQKEVREIAFPTEDHRRFVLRLKMLPVDCPCPNKGSVFEDIGTRSTGSG